MLWIWDGITNIINCGVTTNGYSKLMDNDSLIEDEEENNDKSYL